MISKLLSMTIFLLTQISRKKKKEREKKKKKKKKKKVHTASENLYLFLKKISPICKYTFAYEQVLERKFPLVILSQN